MNADLQAALGLTNEECHTFDDPDRHLFVEIGQRCTGRLVGLTTERRQNLLNICQQDRDPLSRFARNIISHAFVRAGDWQIVEISPEEIDAKMNA